MSVYTETKNATWLHPITADQDILDVYKTIIQGFWNNGISTVGGATCPTNTKKTFKTQFTGDIVQYTH